MLKNLVWISLIYAASLSGQESGFQQVDLFAQGDNGFHAYRIPSLITTSKGTILAFAEARKNSRHDHGHLETVLRRSFDGGKTWSPIQVVASDGIHAVQNPTAAIDRSTGTIWLALIRTDAVEYKTEADIQNSKTRARRVWVTHSNDDGASWAKPADITESVCPPTWAECVPGPGVGIQSRGGRLLIPAYYRALGDDEGHATTSSTATTMARGGSAAAAPKARWTSHRLSS